MAKGLWTSDHHTHFEHPIPVQCRFFLHGGSGYLLTRHTCFLPTFCAPTCPFFKAFTFLIWAFFLLFRNTPPSSTACVPALTIIQRLWFHCSVPCLAFPSSFLVVSKLCFLVLPCLFELGWKRKHQGNAKIHLRSTSTIYNIHILSCNKVSVQDRGY